MNILDYKRKAAGHFYRGESDSGDTPAPRVKNTTDKYITETYGDGDYTRTVLNPDYKAPTPAPTPAPAPAATPVVDPRAKIATSLGVPISQVVPNYGQTLGGRDDNTLVEDTTNILGFSVKQNDSLGLNFDTSGNQTGTYTPVKAGSNFLETALADLDSSLGLSKKAPAIVGFAAAYFLPGIGSALGQSLVSSGVITGAAIPYATTIGTALAQTGVSVAQGKPLDQALGDAILSGGMSELTQAYGSGVKSAIRQITDNPIAQNAIFKAGTDVVTAVAQGKTGEQVLQGIGKSVVASVAGDAANELVKNIPGIDNLPDAARRVVTSGIATSIQGGDGTKSMLNTALREGTNYVLDTLTATPGASAANPMSQDPAQQATGTANTASGDAGTVTGGTTLDAVESTLATNGLQNTVTPTPADVTPTPAPAGTPSVVDDLLNSGLVETPTPAVTPTLSMQGGFGTGADTVTGGTTLDDVESTLADNGLINTGTAGTTNAMQGGFGDVAVDTGSEYEPPGTSFSNNAITSDAGPVIPAAIQAERGFGSGSSPFGLGYFAEQYPTLNTGLGPANLSVAVADILGTPGEVQPGVVTAALDTGVVSDAGGGGGAPVYVDAPGPVTEVDTDVAPSPSVVDDLLDSGLVETPTPGVTLTPADVAPTPADVAPTPADGATLDDIESTLADNGLVSAGTSGTTDAMQGGLNTVANTGANAITNDMVTSDAGFVIPGAIQQERGLGSLNIGDLTNTGAGTGFDDANQLASNAGDLTTDLSADDVAAITGDTGDTAAQPGVVTAGGNSGTVTDAGPRGGNPLQNLRAGETAGASYTTIDEETGESTVRTPIQGTKADGTPYTYDILYDEDFPDGQKYSYEWRTASDVNGQSLPLGITNSRTPPNFDSASTGSGAETLPGDTTGDLTDEQIEEIITGGQTSLGDSPTNQEILDAIGVDTGTGGTPTPTVTPTTQPTITPDATPEVTPTVTPATTPTVTPTVTPSLVVGEDEDGNPVTVEDLFPTFTPTTEPTPSATPAITPDATPAATPSLIIGKDENGNEVTLDDLFPKVTPTVTPTIEPVIEPTVEPTVTPYVTPYVTPTVTPTIEPTIEPTVTPAATPSLVIGEDEDGNPVTVDDLFPTVTPIITPPVEPTITPPIDPVIEPTVEPSVTPYVTPFIEPTVEPTITPAVTPAVEPAIEPTITPALTPTITPALTPLTPTDVNPWGPVIEVVVPTVEPTVEPTTTPAITPSITPVVRPVVTPVVRPVVVPTVTPRFTPTPVSQYTSTTTTKPGELAGAAGWEDEEGPIDYTPFQYVTRKKVEKKSDETTKMAQGGSIDELLALLEAGQPSSPKQSPSDYLDELLAAIR